MGKISKLLLNALIASAQAQDFEVTGCSNENVSTQKIRVGLKVEKVDGPSSARSWVKVSAKSGRSKR